MKINIYNKIVTNGNREMSIDLLRIFSMLIVVLFHYQITEHVILTGTHGVVIFFIISGYCMHFSTNNRTGTEFLKARFWRLIPILLLCATVSTIVEISFSEINPDRLHGFKDYLATLLCMPTGNVLCDAIYYFRRGEPISYGMVDGVYWSLLVEIRFYLLLWLLFYVFKIEKAYLAVACLGLLACLNLNISILSKGADFILYLPFFGFGMSYRAWKEGDRYGMVGILLSLIGFFLAAYIGTSGISMGFNLSNFESYGLCFLIFIVVVYITPSIRNTYISFLALLTYPIYLFHQDIGLIFISVFNSYGWELTSILVTLLLVLSLSVAVQLIEIKSKKCLKKVTPFLLTPKKLDI